MAKVRGTTSRDAHINIRLDGATHAAVVEWAEANTGGNVSKAIRELVAIGLDPRSAVEAEMEDVDGKLERLAAHVEAKLDEAAERMVRANSKGAKASMGSLYLLSKYLQPMAAGIEAIGDHIEEHALKVDGFQEWEMAGEYALPFGFAAAQGLMVARDQEIYDYAFNVGGRLNRSGAGTSLAAAEKGLSVLGEGSKEEGR